jgi:hypothetical protein
MLPLPMYECFNPENNQIVSVEPLVTLKAPQLTNLDLRMRFLRQEAT